MSDPDIIPPRSKPPTATETAECYARVFLGSEDGKRVLRDLLTKFPPGKHRFDINDPNPLKAALFDGRSHVIEEIESALRLGSRTIGVGYPQNFTQP